MSYALIDQKGQVAQVESEKFPVAEPLEWVPCGEEIKAGWTYAEGGFIPPVGMTASERKTAILGAICAERDRRTEIGGCLVEGRWFYTDVKSTVRYKVFADECAKAGLSDDTVIRPAWRPMDVGSKGPIDMTYGLLKAVIAAGVKSVMDHDDAAQRHKIALYACDDPESYDYAIGWPEIYEGEA